MTLFADQFRWTIFYLREYLTRFDCNGQESRSSHIVVPEHHVTCRSGEEARVVYYDLTAIIISAFSNNSISHAISRGWWDAVFSHVQLVTMMWNYSVVDNNICTTTTHVNSINSALVLALAKRNHEHRSDRIICVHHCLIPVATIPVKNNLCRPDTQATTHAMYLKPTDW